MKTSSKKFIVLCLVVGLTSAVFVAAIRAYAHSRYDLLASSNVKNEPDPGLKPLYAKVEAYFNRQHLEHSFYYEDLGSGLTVKSDSNREEKAASLLKLPYVMILYHLAETGKVDLDQAVTIEPQWLDQSFGDLWKQGAGSTITLREAAELALTKSDNTAVNVIISTIQQHPEQTAPQFVNASPSSRGNYAYISSGKYATYLRCLYFSCFLNKDDSQAILEHASRTSFRGIVNGLPKSVTVAHKIGVTADDFSDCGIVYHPRHPYIICAMVKAPNAVAVQAVSDISKLTYTQADSIR